MDGEGVDPKDYLAMLALGVGIPTAPHVWDRDMRSSDRGWKCKWCRIPYIDARKTDDCPDCPPDVVRLNG